MFINISCNHLQFLPSLKDVIRIFFSDAQFSNIQENIKIKLIAQIRETAKIFVSIGPEKQQDYFFEEQLCDDEEPHNQLRRASRLALYNLLKSWTGDAGSSWGILTGIRPTKIVHRWLDHNLEKKEIKERLMLRYALDEGKAKLLLDIAYIQRPFLSKEETNKHIGIYIAIPFCPTRCVYCSFSAEPLKKSGFLVKPYLSSLMAEIENIGKVIHTLGLTVTTLYLGGGTPTCIDAQEFESLLGSINNYFDVKNLKEYTVEAGRPDTLSREKLLIMHKLGVSRISINPQTMHQKTLELIGRRHTVREVKEKFYQAVDLGFNINMDLIIGLPGENTEEVAFSFSQVAELFPDNLTVHTLAIKKNSQLHREMEHYSLVRNKEVLEMMEIARDWAQKMDMYPYYLYRQKNILGGLENIGYCRPGKECLYNIMIMEEKQTVVGLGAGAGSKFVETDPYFLSAFYNPKDIDCYRKRLAEVIEKKIDKLKAI